jgi:hypothetical protein
MQINDTYIWRRHGMGAVESKRQTFEPYFNGLFNSVGVEPIGTEVLSLAAVSSLSLLSLAAFPSIEFIQTTSSDPVTIVPLEFVVQVSHQSPYASRGMSNVPGG